jgi:flagellar biosynthetic protein FliP
MMTSSAARAPRHAQPQRPPRELTPPTLGARWLRRARSPLGLCAATLAALLLAGLSLVSAEATAQVAGSAPAVQLSLNGGDGDWVGGLRILALLTLMTLGPGAILTMTCFTRIIIVFSLLRQALGTQQSPPNQVIIALSLFLTAFIMQPVWSKIQNEALVPYMEGRISQSVALDKTLVPVREFMFKHTREKDLALFVQASGDAKPQTRDDIKLYQLIPSFVLSELKTAFQIGFMIYVPFLILDMVVASILMAMGMMMLPPILISLPFKLMLFVLVDGWNLLVMNLIKSFNGAQ